MPKRIRDLLNEFSGWAEAGVLVVTGILSLSVPPFLDDQQTRYISGFGGLVGVAAGALWGWHLRAKSMVAGWARPVILAVASAASAAFIHSIANGSLPDRYPNLLWLYDLFFAAPLLGDVLFSACYAVMWGALASFIRFWAKP